jgi:aminoglycoside phosphotransferase (APT) family kinase protein
MDERLRAWIERETRERVESATRIGAGASRATWSVKLASRELVLRVDTGDGPVAGTELSLAREAVVYRALRGTRVRIPALVAAEPSALLVEHARGSPDLEALAPAERSAILLDYVDALAELHALDPEPLDLPGYRRPRDARDHARAELDLWRGILDARVKRPAPLARFAFAWLERAAPARVERSALCHGDVGPGNFLHESGRVTALLDWEFAHVGDPMDDLGWLAFRGHHMTADAGDLRAQLARWSERTGLPVDSERVAYYRAVVMLRWLVSCLAALDNGAQTLDRSVYFSLVPLLEALLPRALAGLAGLALDAPDAPPTPAENDAAEVADALARDLGGVVLPALAGDAQRRARGSLLLATHLAAEARHGQAVRAAELRSLAAALGRAPDSLAAGRRALEPLAASSSPNEETRWLRFFAELGERRLVLWPFIVPFARRPLAPIPALPAPGATHAVSR